MRVYKCPPTPPPTKVQVRKDTAVIPPDTETKGRQGPAHPAGSGEPAKGTPRTQKHPEAGGAEPHSEDKETEAKPRSHPAGTGQGLYIPRDWG